MTTQNVDPLDTGPEERAQLVGDEGGRWKVVTQGSIHLFDLDAMTVTRIPGDSSRPSVNDKERTIRAILTCEVNRSGFWYLKADPATEAWAGYFWHTTSRIRSITRCDNEPRSHDA